MAVTNVLCVSVICCVDQVTLDPAVVASLWSHLSSTYQFFLVVTLVFGEKLVVVWQMRTISGL